MVSIIDSASVEFHRFGKEPGILREDDRYIRTCGYDTPASEVRVGLGHADVVESLYELRYQSDSAAADVESAQRKLAGEAARFLEGIALAGGTGQLHQLDIVTHAAELWAFPFEAIYLQDPVAFLGGSGTGLVLTRRVRAEYTESASAWPTRPSILFVHAQLTHDLSQDLISRHRQALVDALAPWGQAAELEKEGLLRVREVCSIEELRAAMTGPSPACSYVHVLAHGAQLAGRTPLQSAAWGLRLGDEGCDAVAPEEIAAALASPGKLPLVVTLAACDAANQGSPEFATYSLAQALHRRGIPVVLGSQFPLTKDGSEALARVFYHDLVCGQDVRVALHATRVALFADKARHHDWLSLVGYVRLPPEGYTAHLAEFGLRAELGMLKVAQQEADALSAQPQSASREDFDRLENRLHERLASLQALVGPRVQGDRELREEYYGLLGSANKRLAELLYLRSLAFVDTAQRDRLAAREALHSALDAYGTAFRDNLSSHWTGIQKLALELILNGALEAPLELDIVLRAAELARDAAPTQPGKVADYWSCGTIAEVILLSSLSAQPIDPGRAKEALLLLRERASLDPHDAGYALQSTRRQLLRYTTWWTVGNGFFKDGGDLARVAAELVESLQGGPARR